MEYKLRAERQANTTLLEQILLNRGFKDLQEINHYLTVDEHDINDPLLLDNMQEGAKMLAKHIQMNSKTLVVQDPDADGMCSTAILLNYLNRLFPGWVQNQVDYFIHSGKQHGLEDALQESNWLLKGYHFIIVPDAASNDYECHKLLKEHGVDCLILDHHMADGGYSQDAIVINNQLSKNYPNKTLCGGAVVWQFCNYIDSLMKTNYAIEYEDLAALSLIGDMMDLRNCETHQIIKDGLQRIRNPFFLEMMNRQKFQFEGGITPIGIAFYIVPYINAMTRSGTMEEKLLVLEAMLEWKSDLLIPSTKRGCKGQVETRHEQAGRTCVNVKSRQKKAQDNSLNYVEELIAEDNLLDNKILIARVPEDIVDKNLAGLIANQIANKYARPTLILRITKDEEGNTLYAGSGRNYSNSKLDNFREFCLDTNLVSYSQGHAQAFGTAIPANNYEEFVKETNKELEDFDFSPCYLVDLEVTMDQLTDQEIFSLGSNADLWGQQLDEPLIAIKNIELTKDSIQFIGSNKNTLKITFPNRKISILKFNVKEEEKLLLSPEDGKIEITAIGKCAINHYNGNITPQILLEDFEIVNRKKWDF